MESAQEFGRRAKNLAMELYEGIIQLQEEGKNHTVKQQRAILENIKEQALYNYQIGLHDEIKLLVQSQHYGTLQEAIIGASAEEKVKGHPVRNSAYQNKLRGNSLTIRTETDIAMPEVRENRALRARLPQQPVCHPIHIAATRRATINKRNLKKLQLLQKNRAYETRMLIIARLTREPRNLAR